MTIGILKLTLFIHDSNSLKAKRMVLHSLKARLRNEAPRAKARGFLERNTKAAHFFILALQGKVFWPRMYKFNVAVTQIGDEDKWQKSTVAVVGVEKDRRNMDSALCKIINFIDAFDGAQLIDHEMEMV